VGIDRTSQRGIQRCRAWSVLADEAAANLLVGSNGGSGASDGDALVCLTVIPSLLESISAPRAAQSTRTGRSAMLPPFIIEQIRRREEESRRDADRPRLELPLPVPGPVRRRTENEDEGERGVVILDLGS
jgi:hypothetical protein